ncbi:MAG: type II toxin-antitoxin system RelE/ParE family toxin [bacterium]|nr:type II toxin-antitoxin system RelE/ParE family toxin [bacterium]
MPKFGDNSQSDWRVVYHFLVVKNDLVKITKTDLIRIKRAIESKLMIDPVVYGLPLRGSLKQYWKLRVGNWRLVYNIYKNEVRILIIAHRREVYKLAPKRDF